MDENIVSSTVVKRRQNKCCQGIPAGGVTKPSVTTVPTQGVLAGSCLQA